MKEPATEDSSCRDFIAAREVKTKGFSGWMEDYDSLAYNEERNAFIFFNEAKRGSGNTTRGARSNCDYIICLLVDYWSFPLWLQREFEV
jgi:hypothetical protein